MAVLEAWACGVPSMMTEACNLDVGFDYGAAIRSGMTVDDIVTSLSIAFETPEARHESMSRAALALIDEQFSPRVIGAQMAAFYLASVAQPGRRVATPENGRPSHRAGSRAGRSARCRDDNVHARSASAAMTGYAGRSRRAGPKLTWRSTPMTRLHRHRIGIRWRHRRFPCREVEQPAIVQPPVEPGLVGIVVAGRIDDAIGSRREARDLVHAAREAAIEQAIVGLDGALADAVAAARAAGRGMSDVIAEAGVVEGQARVLAAGVIHLAPILVSEPSSVMTLSVVLRFCVPPEPLVSSIVPTVPAARSTS